MAYTKRSDGRYQVRIYIGKVDGKKKFKYLYADSVSELKKLESQYRLKNEKGVDLLSLEDTYEEWLKRLKPVFEVKKSEKEYETWLARAEHFVPYIGNTKLKNITQMHLQPIINDLFVKNPSTGKPTAKKTLQRYVMACSAVFDYAIQNRATDFNPCKYVEIPKGAPKGERRALTEIEQKWIRETPHRAQLPAMIMMYAGLRRGEITALTWNDIDLKEKTIIVNKSYDFQQKTLKSTKTVSGERIVTIPQVLANYLMSVKKDGIYVITTPHGKIMTNKAWEQLWEDYLCELDNKYGCSMQQIPKNIKKAEKQYSIETFTPHCLRHTYCTILYDAGVDVLTCKQLMGHKDIQTTLNIYTHLTSKRKKKSINQLDEYLAGVSSK